MLIFSGLIIQFWKWEKDVIAKQVNVDDFDLNSKNVSCILVVGFIAGLSSSSLGLGAGTIINPILIGYLENYPPSVLSY